MQNRRQLLKKTATFTAAFGAMTFAVAVPFKKAWAALKLVDPASNPIAKALKYVHSTKDAKGKADKMGIKAADQKCNNCQLYTKAGEIKGEEVGNCSMIAGVQVKGEGWCVSWVKSAKAAAPAKKPAAPAKKK